MIDRIIHIVAEILELTEIPDWAFNDEFRGADGSLTEWVEGGFSIELPRANTLRLIFIISHEMVHFHQHMRGDLENGFGGFIKIWQGQPFNMFGKLTLEEYKALPWEAEAFRLEKSIARQTYERLKRDLSRM